LTQNVPFSRMAVQAGLRLLIQTNTVGGSADTDEKALTVSPKRPAGPSVVTTLTPVAVPRIARMNAALVTESIALLIPANNLIDLSRRLTTAGAFRG
jgi:hypothetical protein